MNMDINQRKNLIAKIIADLRLLIEESWSIDVADKLRSALRILEANDGLEGYDD